MLSRPPRRGTNAGDAASTLFACMEKGVGKKASFWEGICYGPQALDFPRGGECGLSSLCSSVKVAVTSALGVKEERTGRACLRPNLKRTTEPEAGKKSVGST